MLVYANQLELVGENPALQVLRAVAGWLSEKMDERLAIKEITSHREFSGGNPRAWVRIDRAVGASFTLYSWILKHSDAQVSGRQWVTELGLKEDEEGAAHFSCIVYTEEKSTLISDSVQASRPRVVRFIFDNVQNEKNVSFAAGSVGSAAKWIGNGVDSYRALLAEVHSEARDYPLVIISPDNAGDYLVDPNRLQQTLFGLAQVVGVTENFNSYEMSEVLGREYSAWSGAINIVRTRHRDGRVFSQLILSRDVPIECDTRHKKECYVLGRVSHNTNIPKQRNRIRPEGVRTLAAKQRLENRLAALADKPDEALRDELGMVYEELGALNNQLEESQLAKDSLELTFLENEEKIQDLEKQIRTHAFQFSERSNLPRTLDVDEEVVDELVHLASDANSPTPERCLNVLAKVYPRRLVVLPSAIEASRRVDQFSQTRRLLDMLNRLVTEYLPNYLENGDSGARAVFTNNEFAARESDTVTNNRQYMTYRTFRYDGQDLEMTKHLKVGVADDPKSTIRVHFEVDQSSERVVIGHCGPHLPLPGR